MCLLMAMRRERTVVCVGSLQEVALVVSQTTKFHEVCSVYLARVICLTAKLVWPWDNYLFKSLY